MSAHPSKADINRRAWYVRLVPIADINHHLFSAVVMALIKLVQFGGPGLATVSSCFSYLISQVALWLTI